MAPAGTQPGVKNGNNLSFSGSGARTFLSWLPVEAFAVITVALVWWRVDESWNSPVLLAALNGVFLGIIPFMVAVLAAHSYLAGHDRSVLLLGCGSLALGCGALMAALPPSTSDPNYTATVYNSGALLASMFHFVGSSLAFRDNEQKRRSRGLLLMLLYPIVFLAMISTAVAVRFGVFPPFFIDGAGATFEELIVLWSAAGLFGISSALLWINYRKTRSAFSRWYAPGLGLLVIGLLAVSFQKQFGSPLNWTGRSAQYIAGIYTLAGVISAVRRSRTWVFSLENALRDVERRYRSLIEMSPDPIVVTRDDLIEFANPAAVRLFGAGKSDDLVGRPLLELFRASNGSGEAGWSFDLLSSPAPPLVERRIHTISGEIRDVEIAAAPLWDSDGLAVQIVLRDMTERKRASESLRQSEHRYHMLSEATVEGIAMTEGGRFLDVNEQFSQMFRYSREELIGRSVDMLLPPDELETVMPNIQNSIESMVEHKAVAKDGRILVVEAHGKTVVYEGRPVRLTTILDITDRKQAEEALRESEKKYRELVQNANSAIVRWRGDGTITFFNEYAQSFFGYASDEIVGRPVSVLLPPTDSSGIDLEAMISDITRNPERYLQNVNENIRRDGSRVVMAWTNKPVFDENHKLVEILAVGTDITDRKRAEEALRDAADELKRSNQELEQFAYAASHDLQEPLRMINGFLQLLRERCGERLDEKGKEYVQYSIEGSIRMAQLIRDLLDYSRVERKGRTLRPSDTARSLAVALSNLSNSIEEAHAEITSGELPIVMGDSVQLNQLFQNLIGNALKFRSPGKPCQIEIGARKDEDCWEFSVKDNGIGIEAKDVDRIFVIFQRLHSRSKYPGTGIGLAICKRIVERHGGRIWVESKLGEGSDFHFTLNQAAALQSEKQFL